MVVLIVLNVDVTTGFVDGLEVLVVDFTVDGFFVVVFFVVGLVFVVGFGVAFVVGFGVVVFVVLGSIGS